MINNWITTQPWTSLSNRPKIILCHIIKEPTIDTDSDGALPGFELLCTEYLFVGSFEFLSGSGQPLSEKIGHGELSVFASPILSSTTPSLCYLFTMSLRRILKVSLSTTLSIIYHKPRGLTNGAHFFIGSSLANEMVTTMDVSRSGSGWSCEQPTEEPSRKIQSRGCRYLPKVCVLNSRIIFCSFSHCSLVVYYHSSFVCFQDFILFLSKLALDFALCCIWATAATY